MFACSQSSDPWVSLLRLEPQRRRNGFPVSFQPTTCWYSVGNPKRFIPTHSLPIAPDRNSKAFLAAKSLMLKLITESRGRRWMPLILQVNQRQTMRICRVSLVPDLQYLGHPPELQKMGCLQQKGRATHTPLSVYLRILGPSATAAMPAPAARTKRTSGTWGVGEKGGWMGQNEPLVLVFICQGFTLSNPQIFTFTNATNRCFTATSHLAQGPFVLTGSIRYSKLGRIMVPSADNQELPFKEGLSIPMWLWIKIKPPGDRRF